MREGESAAGPATGRWWRGPRSQACVVGLLAVLLYAPTMGYGLVNVDSPWLVRDNVLVQRPSAAALARIWLDLSPETRLQLGGEYLPIRDLSIMLDYLLYGRRYAGFHLTNALLYGVLCGVLLLLLRRWTGDEALALAAALLYLTHPLHVESVAWIAERKGLLGGVLALAAALSLRRFAVAGGCWRLALAIAAQVLAVWSKGLAVAAVGFTAALLWLFPPAPERSRRAWIGWASTAVASALAFVPVWIAGARLTMVGEHHGGSVGATAALMAEVHGWYLKHAALVGELGLWYPVDAAHVRPWAAAFGALAFAGICAVAWWAAWRRAPRWRVPGLAAAAWLCFLAPVSQVLFPLQNAIADRYTLLPSIGWCVALGAGVLALPLPRPPLRWALVGALALTQGALTLAQGRSWADDLALYSQALRAHPRSVEARIQLARIEREAGHPARSARWLAEARQLDPNESRVPLHEALLLLGQGQRAPAIATLRRAARDPRADRVRANLALLLLDAGETKEALRWARSAVRFRALGYHNQQTLGVVALRSGLLDEAESALRRADRLRPEHPTTLYNLALVALRRGRREEACALLARAARGAGRSSERATRLLREVDAQRRP